MIQVIALAHLPRKESKRAVAHVALAVFDAEGKLLAIDDNCTHQDGSLSDGWLKGCLTKCRPHAPCSPLSTRTGSTPSSPTMPSP
jgi:3-phenylpropionate/trans-cinnamate dioxygenase ferredoxin subunit